MAAYPDPYASSPLHAEITDAMLTRLEIEQRRHHLQLSRDVSETRPLNVGKAIMKLRHPVGRVMPGGVIERN